jgi:hypothetical protein
MIVLAAAALGLVAAVTGTAPAQKVCVDATVIVNGSTVVDQGLCMPE